MRIWIVNQYAIPPTQAGITRHYLLAKAMIEHGHDVTIVASSFDHVTRRETRLSNSQIAALEVVEGVPFVWVKTPPYLGNNLARVWNMIVFSIRVSRRTGFVGVLDPEIIVGSSPHLLGAYAAERVAAKVGVPFVLEVRDLWPQSLVDLGNVSDRNLVVKTLEAVERQLYKRARHIITLLPGAERHLVGKGASPDKIVWLPNGVDLASVPAPVRPVEDGVFTVMYAGSHGFGNGLDVVLETARMAKESTLLGDKVLFRLLGDGPQKPRLMDLARQWRLDNVRFEAPVPKNEVFQVLCEADAFLLSLKRSKVFRWGVSPNKLFDYFAAARPVIFSVDTAYDPVRESQAGISVPPEDPWAILEAISRLLELAPGERWSMGLRGRRYVEERHDIGRIGAQFQQILEDISYQP